MNTGSQASSPMAQAHFSPLQPAQRIPLASRSIAQRLDFSASARTPQRPQRQGSPHSRVVRSATTTAAAGDRFIPDRISAENWEARLNFTPSKSEANRDLHDESSRLYNQILRNELLCSAPSSSGSVMMPSATRTPPQSPVYSFKGCATPRKSPQRKGRVEAAYSHTRSPLSKASQDLLLSPRKACRTISTAPYKVLDAPDLQDDFYLNLLDWSKTNLLSVALGPSIYLWNGGTGHVSKLFQLNLVGGREHCVTSVSFSEDGDSLAVGTSQGMVEIWDVNTCKMTSTLRKHSHRVASIAWNKDLIATGSRDHKIFIQDTRLPTGNPRVYSKHTQEVCGLKWSPDQNYLASGGNDNMCHIWSLHSDRPTFSYSSHTAAVKALAWSPYQHGVLATGGGTADQTIRFWNAFTGAELSCVKTGSQVCNILFSTTSSELVSSHGYSQNYIRVWTFPRMQELARLSGHTYRVLYMALSPDGQSIVTGAGDETLRFWKVFESRKTSQSTPSVVNSFSPLR